jgi:hypothetical protein
MFDLILVMDKFTAADVLREVCWEEFSEVQGEIKGFYFPCLLIDCCLPTYAFNPLLRPIPRTTHNQVSGFDLINPAGHYSVKVSLTREAARRESGGVKRRVEE